MKLADFAGHWQIQRQIADQRAGRDGSLRGRAVFTATTTGLHYEEEGVLAFAGQPGLTARQSYHWQSAGAGVAVSFADGRAFHDFSLTQPVQEVRHACAPDFYIGQYDFSRWPIWTLRWQVSGAHKDYLMTTTYRRPKAGSTE